jgi:DNA-binding winged helix-turn-helix (wHTH) protein/TolB-like protein/Flp pilus assembly protein TadD
MLQAGRLYEFSLFRLDTSEGVLFAGNEPVHLTPKALQTLTLLVDRSGHIVNKDEFFEKVWANAFVEDAVLSFNISQLRKTLAQFDQETQFIETVPKRGFRFAAEVREIIQENNFEEVVLELHNIERISYEETVETDGSALDLVDVSAVKAPLLLPPIQKFNHFYLSGGIGILLIVIMIGSIFYFRQNSTNAVPTSVQIERVAVLPFQNLNGSEQSQTLSLGLTDALISRLGSLNRFAVRPLSAVQKYSANEKDPLIFGTELRVDAILEGTMQMVDNRLRVNARLLKVGDGSQIWAGSFDQTETDIFKLQDEISTQVTQKLNLKLSQQEHRQLTLRSTENNEAYELYLRGRYYWNQRTGEGFERALQLFQQAVTLDPRFAEAYVGIGNAYLGFYDYGLKQARETIPQAKNAINKALELNSDLSEAHDLKAALEFLHDRDWKAAKKSFERAIELKPNDPTSRMRYGFMLIIKGNFDEAERELRIAEQLDPTSTIVQTNIGYLYFCSRRYDEAERQLKKVTKDNPDFSLPLWYLSGIYYLQGNHQEMMASYIQANALDGETELAQKIEQTRKKAGESAAIQVWLEELERRYQKKYSPPYNIALAAALQKNTKKTLYWLMEAEKQNDPWLLQYKYDPEFDFIREKEQFIELEQKMNFD